MSAHHTSSSDQIAELTRGISLPLAPIPIHIMKALVKGFVDSWHEILTRYSATVKNENEPDVTCLLETRLKNYIQENDKWKSLVITVDRGVETVNFDGTRIELRPDLSILLKKRDCRFRLIVECKLIDHSSGKTIDLYCKKGINRFIVGDYAWAAREAFMLAYVRDESCIHSQLKSHLDSAAKLTPIPYLTIGTQNSPASYPQALNSVHNRSFVYEYQVPSGSPDTITIWHVWLHDNS